MILQFLLHFLKITLCLNLSGFLFEDNRSAKRWIEENGEISYTLPRWYSQIGYVQVKSSGFYWLNLLFISFVRCCFTAYVDFDRYSSLITFLDLRYPMTSKDVSSI